MTDDISSNRNIIGDTVKLFFTNLVSSNEVTGKVDTGATVCSLHCDKFNINEKTQQISFVCAVLSPNVITVALGGKQAVKNASGTTYRPVIELNVNIDGFEYENIQFNLTDRGNMDVPVLVGQNLIKAGNFLIDPKPVSEKVDLEKDDLDKDDVDSIESLLKSLATDKDDADITDLVDRTSQLNEIIKLMRNSDITLKELLDHASEYIADEEQILTDDK